MNDYRKRPEAAVWLNVSGPFIRPFILNSGRLSLSLYCPLLELDRTDVTNVAISALAIVKTLNVVEHIRGWAIESKRFLQHTTEFHSHDREPG